MSPQDQQNSDEIHPESLLRIPLLSQLLADPHFSIVRRGVDSRWKYEEVISARVDGFNPLRAAAFVGTNSRFDLWLPHRRGSARPFNQGDELMSEALFVVHDYLHSLTYRWIDALRPQLGFGRQPVTRKNFEDMAFCHILSEAVATVGLDYWYLSTIDLAQVVPIGSVQRGLTVSYRESRRDEYRRFNPALNVQHPSFLGQLTRFYCDGIFVGFAAADLTHSPAIESWITHELRYGQLQRRYCRQWFSYLATDDVQLTEAQLDAPLDHDDAWKRRLVSEISDLLWTQVKDDKASAPGMRFDPDETWQAPPARSPDFRFLNLNRCEPLRAPAIAGMSGESFEYLLRQYVARFDYESFPEEALEVFVQIREKRDFSIGEHSLGGLKRLPVAAAEPRDLFFYN